MATNQIMGKTVYIKIALICFLFFTVVDMMAQSDRYRIIFLNCQAIKIGNAKKRVGDEFNGDQKIWWTNSRQFMKIRNIKTSREYKLTCNGFKKHGNPKSLSDFLIQERFLVSRGNSYATHYTQQDFYLVDTLQFETFNSADPEMVMEAVWMNGKKEVVTPIKRTPDDRFYIVSTAVFGNQKAQDIKLTIRERSKDNSWVNNVYQNIPIIYIPKKL